MVCGEVTPDQFLVNKITMEIVKRTISDKEIYFTTNPETTRSRKLEVEAERRTSKRLLDEEIMELARLAKLIEKALRQADGY